MIYADNSNYRLGSSIPHCEGEVQLPNLESLSGADYMLSPVDYEITKRYHVQEHLEAGAVLIALKVGGDLLSSVGDRLKGHLVKMQTYVLKPCQSGLLSVGYNLEVNGQVYIGEQSASTANVFGIEAKKIFKGGYTPNFKALYTSELRWVLSGGVIYPTVPRLVDLPTALAAIEREVIETHKDPSRYHFETLTKVPDRANPDKQSLQVLVAVPDGVNILAAMPGIGNKRALEYYEFYSSDLMVAIINLTSPDGNWPKGWASTRARTLALAWGIEQKEPA